MGRGRDGGHEFGNPDHIHRAVCIIRLVCQSGGRWGGFMVEFGDRDHSHHATCMHKISVPQEGAGGRGGHSCLAVQMFGVAAVRFVANRGES